MQFTAKGHKNILATHKTTIEFTKDASVTKNGDCILGISADFDLTEIKEWIKNKNKVKVIFEVDEETDCIEGEINHEFNDNHEIVFRMGSYASSRTLLINNSKGAKYINRMIVEKMKVEGNKMMIKLEEL